MLRSTFSFPGGRVRLETDLMHAGSVQGRALPKAIFSGKKGRYGQVLFFGKMTRILERHCRLYEDVRLTQGFKALQASATDDGRHRGG